MVMVRVAEMVVEMVAAKAKKAAPPGNEISQWGKAISTDGKGRPDLFELDLGNGNKHFTHVIWAN